MPKSAPLRNLSLPAVLRVAAGLLLVVFLAGCASLPDPVERTPSYTLKDTATTTLARAAAPLIAAHPGLTGIHPLRDGREDRRSRHGIDPSPAIG